MNTIIPTSLCFFVVESALSLIDKVCCLWSSAVPFLSFPAVLWPSGFFITIFASLFSAVPEVCLLPAGSVINKPRSVSSAASESWTSGGFAVSTSRWLSSTLYTLVVPLSLLAGSIISITWSFSLMAAGVLHQSAGYTCNTPAPLLVPQAHHVHLSWRCQAAGARPFLQKASGACLHMRDLW